MSATSSDSLSFAVPGIPTSNSIVGFTNTHTIAPFLVAATELGHFCFCVVHTMAATTATWTSRHSTTRQQQQRTLWGGIKDAGKRASIVGQKAMLGADIVVIDHKIKTRKQQFGIDLYDYLAQQADHDPMFLIDHPALDQLRGHFVTCYKDNKALIQKSKSCHLQLAAAAEQRKCVNSRHQGKLSYPVPADTVGERILNAPKLACIAGSEAKIRTSMACIQQEMMARKQTFGMETFSHLLKLEHVDQWLPVDTTVRILYDDCRRDISQYEILKDEKGDDIHHLDKEVN